MMRQNKKANIHDILQREINLKQQNHLGGGGFSHTINNRIVLSNQTSPIKGLSEQYENYRGIDLSSQRSPFKQMNKQLQA
jgi:predicted transcriptional regulator